MSYLGCSSVNAPRSESEALRTISILRAQHAASHASGGIKDTVIPGMSGETSQQIEIVLSVPNTADGVVRYAGFNFILISVLKVYFITVLCKVPLSFNRMHQYITYGKVILKNKSQ